MSASPQRGTNSQLPTGHEREPKGSEEFALETNFDAIAQNNSDAENDVDPNRP